MDFTNGCPAKSNWEEKTEAFSNLIKQLYEKSHQIYDSPRITVELNKKNHTVSRSYVARLMKKMNLRIKTLKKFKVTTDFSHTYEIAKNLLQEIFQRMAYRKNGLGRYLHKNRVRLALS